VNRYDRILPIELPREHRPNLGGLNVALERGEALLEIGRHVFALPGPVDEHDEIVCLSPQRRGERLVVLEPAPALLNSLRGGLILPEVWRGGLRVELAQLAIEPGLVKAPSADRRPDRSVR
jgi:hypothetical protein